jgi:hypothetical protein
VPPRFAVNKRGLALPSSTCPAGRFKAPTVQRWVHPSLPSESEPEGGSHRSRLCCVQQDDGDEVEELLSVNPPAGQLVKEKKKKK